MKKPNGEYVSCNECVFWDEDCISKVKGRINYTESVCKRYPPVHRVGLIDDAEHFTNPWTAEDDWCGEFVPKTVGASMDSSGEKDA